MNEHKSHILKTKNGHSAHVLCDPEISAKTVEALSVIVDKVFSEPLDALNIPTQKELKAFRELWLEHRERELFTRYLKNEFDRSVPICSNIMMERLERKQVVVKHPYKRNYHQPFKYKWGESAKTWSEIM